MAPIILVHHVVLNLPGVFLGLDALHLRIQLASIKVNCWSDYDTSEEKLDASKGLFLKAEKAKKVDLTPATAKVWVGIE
jgi:hypothetical protein